MLTIFKERLENERRQFALLSFLRKKYQLFALADDPYLSPKLIRSNSQELKKLLRANTSTNFVLVLNPKSSIKPKGCEETKNNQLSKEWELLRRIVVEVKKPARKVDGEEEG